jgi:hypothetical protein
MRENISPNRSLNPHAITLLKKNAPLLAAGSPNPKRGIPKGARLPLSRARSMPRPRRALFYCTNS